MISYCLSQRWRVSKSGAALSCLFFLLVLGQPARAVIRDGGIDPANLGKGEWIYSVKDATNRLGGHISSVTNEVSLFKYYKNIGVRYVMIKMGTGSTNYSGCYASPHQVTVNLCNIARTNGVWVFGYTRSYGSDIAGESALADSVFNNGADGFVFDAEAEWESSRAWIGTNGPALAWQMCGMVRSNWPTKFLAHSPFPVIDFHSSFPYKEFGYWCDATMPQVYHLSGAGLQGSPSAVMNWMDVNFRKWQNGLSGMWTNAIKPVIPVQDVYGEPGNASGRCNGTTGAQPPEDVMEFIDYAAADPNCITATGYQGVNFWRADLHGTNQFAYITAGTSGNFPGVVNNIVMDDAAATKSGAWTAVKTFGMTNSTSTTTPSFYGMASGTGSDTNSFGTNYWVKGQGAGTAYMQFTPNVPVAGDYNVYQWHVNRTDASTNVPFFISYNGGTTTVAANQATNSGNWTLLGRFNFAAGTNGYIRVLDNFSEAGAVAVVDGIKLVFAPLAIPTAPSGLTATAISTTRVDLAWTDNSTNEAGFIIARGTVSGGPYTNLTTVNAAVTNYSSTDLSTSTAYYFVVRSLNSLGESANSSQATATTLGITNPPSISAQPVSATNNAGTPATFSVTASGTAPLTFQWRKNGSPLSNGGNISGATSATLTITTVLGADAAVYNVVVSNSIASINSSNATLTVIDPLITSQPASRTNDLGTTATFSVVATGTTPLSYQWKKNGVDMSNLGNVSGATSATLTLSSVTALDAANYTVQVSNSYSNVTSATATLTVNTAPIISSQPASRTNIAGTTATFSVTATGAPPVSYQWRKAGVVMSNGGNVAGATSTTLTLSNVSQSDATNYSVVVSNASGTVTSSTATLTVLDPPAITTQPQSMTNNAGTPGTFSVVANGTAPLHYQWRFNANNLSGATATSYTRSTVLTNHAGNYVVVITNVAGAVTSSIASLTVTGSVQAVGLTNIWNIRAGSRDYVTTNNTERGITLSPVSSHALIVSRSTLISNSLGIYILDSDTGAELGTMSVAGITNTGTFKLNKIGVADDGVIYGANLTTASPGSPFIIYRWSDENSTPTVAYSGAPDGTARWGDSFDVRGAGTNTQIIASGSSSPTNAAIFTTSDGINFTATKVNPSPAISGGEFSKGLSFGNGNTFFAKNNGASVAKHYSFNLGTSSATFITNIPSLETSMVAIGIDLPNNLLAGVLSDTTTNNANHRLKIYNITNLTAPVAISSFNFLTNSSGTNSGNSNFAGGADSDGLRIVGLDTQNGVVALKIIYVVPPTLQSQPESRTNIAGTTATFTIDADGTGPLSYQWRKNGNDLSDTGNVSGATTETLTLSDVSAGDAASYSVVVGNAAGFTNSANATLTVIEPPAITSQPNSQTNNAGSITIFSVAATGTGPLSFQWKKGAANLSDGGNVSGATTASLTLTGISQSDVAVYSVVVSNSANSVSSATATLTVIDPPVISAQPSSQTLGAGSNAVFTVAATGVNLIYVWSKNNSPLANGGNVSGATTASLTLSGISQSDAASYTVVVTNSAGGVTSAPPALLTVIDPPAILSDPASRTNNANTTATFSVSANGTSPLSYQWRKDGEDLTDGGDVSGATSPTLILDNVLLEDAADYDVVVSNGAGSAASAIAILEVIDPVILSQPASLTNNAGTTASFTVAAEGTVLAYQWRKDAVDLFDQGNVSGSTSPTLVITNLLAADAGIYSVVVKNESDATVTSSNAFLTVIDPIITLHPNNSTATQGNTVNFNVAAFGTGPLVFQWRKNNLPLTNGGNVFGATTASLTLTGVTSADAASYSVSITNNSGAVTSSNATLTVQGSETNKPTITITLPTRTNVAIITLTGSAKDTAPGIPTEVWYRLLPETNFSQAALSGITWQVPNITLSPGTNTFNAYAVDSSGNHSLTNSRTIFYDSTNFLTVNIIGGGLVKNAAGLPVTNGQQIPLLVGRPSLLTASIPTGTPATNYVFSNWFGTITSTNPALKFLMQSNMTLTAQFILNPFMPVAGQYNGLFHDESGVVTHRTAGFITVNLSGRSTYSGKILLDGDVVSISGKFDLSGRTSKIISRAAKFGKSDLTLELAIDWSTPSQRVFGTIGDGIWSSEIAADLSVFSLANPATNFVGRYTMLIPRTNYPAQSPGGFGYGLITNSLAGKIVLSGRLGDGALISQSVPISKNGQWPLYVPLYKNTNLFVNGITFQLATNKADSRGSLLGWITFTNSVTAPTGTVSWIKTGVAGTNNFNTNYFYPAGFSNLLDIIASPFNPPPIGQRLLQFTNATLLAADGNLAAPTAWNATLASNNLVTVSYAGTNKVTLTLTRTTGLMTGKFPHGNNSNTNTTFYGAMLQNQNYAAGQFPGRTDAGSPTNQTGSIIFSED